jgi:hypothetical protein
MTEDRDSEKPRNNAGQFVKTRSPDDVYDAMNPAEPYTTGELTDVLGWPQRSVYQALDDLANAGEIRKKKTGPRQAIWIRPEEQT